jgi:hypothetical protein
MTLCAGNLYFLPDTSPRNQSGFAPSRQDVAAEAEAKCSRRKLAQPRGTQVESREPVEGRRGSRTVAGAGFSGVAG